MEGLTATGGLSVLRVDRLLERIGNAGDVVVIGVHRSKRYRLTNAGLAKARQIAADLLATVA
jgi:DNA-binding transcriptional regulator PaaX